MAEDEELTDQSNEPAAAPAETPAPTTEFDLSELEAMLDKRFGGFQSLFDRKFRDLANDVDQLKTANLTPEEQAQLAATKDRDEKEALRRENALLKMAAKYPEEVAFLEEFFGAKSLEEQVLAASGFRKVTAPVEEEETPAPTPTPDANNPRRRTRISTADTAGGMTAELADQILAEADQPGMLVRVRRALGQNS